MPETNSLKDQQKLRKAQVITPPNSLKAKVGSGGLDQNILTKAEETLQHAVTTTDFTPIADALLQKMDAALQALQTTPQQSEAMIESLLHPVAQFKAQGGMYGFPLVSDISDTLINFLEAAPLPMPAEALDLVAAHRKALTAVVHTKIRDAANPQGGALKTSLADACDRFFKSRK